MQRSVLFVMMSIFLLAMLPAMACGDKNEYIEFGSGGGFTGAYKEYRLDKKGNVYLKKGEHLELQTTISKAQVKDIFKKIDELNDADWKLNDPGNMTYYVRHFDDDEKHSATWGGNTQPSAPLKSLYDLLTTLLNKTS